MSDVKITDNSKLFIDNKDDALGIALEAVGMQAEAHAKRNITKAGAVATNRLRSSISHATDPKNEVVYVGTNVKYAPYVEYGTGIYASNGMGRKTPWAFKDIKGKWHMTRGTKAVHYLRDAAQNHVEEYKRIVKRYLKGY